MKKIIRFILPTIAMSVIACGAVAERRMASNTNAVSTNTEAAATPVASPANPAAGPVTSSSKTTEVKVFLIASGDNGKNGKKIGCDDSLVPVSRTIQPTAAPLRAALDELLSTPEESNAAGQKFGNYWKGVDLKVKSVSLTNGVATIHITGRLYIAGICDEPRIEEQIQATAKQFPTVKRVRVFVNGTPLKEAIR
jgi:spore germination protein GerM